MLNYTNISLSNYKNCNLCKKFSYSISMRSFFVSLFFTIVFFNISFAYDSNKAFFFVYEKEEYIEINCKLNTNSIKQALEDHFPSISYTNNKEVIKYLFQYTNEHLKLSDKNNQTILLDSIKRIYKTRRYDQIEYTLYFEKKKLHNIKNTMMFNVFKDQQNFIHIPDNYQTRIANITSPSIFCKKRTPNSYKYIWGIITSAVVIVVAIGIFNSNRNDKN